MTPVAVCLLKQRLIEQARKAIEDLLRLNNEDMQAVLDADWRKTAKLEVELQAAREARDTAMEAYRQHVIEHGC